MESTASSLGLLCSQRLLLQRFAFDTLSDSSRGRKCWRGMSCSSNPLEYGIVHQTWLVILRVASSKGKDNSLLPRWFYLLVSYVSRPSRCCNCCIPQALGLRSQSNSKPVESGLLRREGFPDPCQDRVAQAKAPMELATPAWAPCPK